MSAGNARLAVDQVPRERHVTFLGPSGRAASMREGGR